MTAREVPVCLNHDEKHTVFNDGTSLCLFCLDALVMRQGVSVGADFLRHVNLLDNRWREFRDLCQMVCLLADEPIELVVGREVLKLAMRHNISPNDAIHRAVEIGPTYLLN